MGKIGVNHAGESRRHRYHNITNLVQQTRSRHPVDEIIWLIKFNLPLYSRAGLIRFDFRLYPAEWYWAEAEKTCRHVYFLINSSWLIDNGNLRETIRDRKPAKHRRRDAGEFHDVTGRIPRHPKVKRGLTTTKNSLENRKTCNNASNHILPLPILRDAFHSAEMTAPIA